ncbi:hypothetical protein L195_g047480 [Trifolium pratense]|uniref:Uncharacterized protein n=1 Tax=Trifolium pratense TaxID=57577 RepID=A0A2K3MKQ8_TRIPR|nr:hypothetical protein L195_g047480 [Trifolium pratense]
MFLLGVGYPPYFILEPVEFVGVSSWVSMGQEDWRPSSCFVLPVVDPYLFLPWGFSSSRSGDFEGF